ncbi:hypothetical protein [Actinomadura chokoriensis]|uniref:PH domain-containing protein n=1 Tax=Actinomadura chokoriensis TaxID=454156 RepID=A0ABV4R5C9_9ACTN
MELDVGVSASLKAAAAGMTASFVIMEGFLVNVLVSDGAVGMPVATVVLLLCLWSFLCLSLCLVAVLSIFRYRVWLEGTTLCVQKPFRVHRSDLAKATTIDVQENARGVPYLVVRGGGRALLQARMLTSKGQPLPHNQLDALYEAIAAGPAGDAPGARSALARLRTAHLTSAAADPPDDPDGDRERGTI